LEEAEEDEQVEDAQDKPKEELGLGGMLRSLAKYSPRPGPMKPSELAENKDKRMLQYELAKRFTGKKTDSGGDEAAGATYS